MKDLNSTEIRKNIEQFVVFGKNWGWWRRLVVSEVTLNKIMVYIKQGRKIRIGNAPRSKYEKIAVTNSKFHGKCVRTIHAI